MKHKVRNLPTIIVAVIITIALLFYLFTFKVRITEIAIVTTFGKPTQTINEPGLYWKLPYPFQDYVTFDSRLQIFSGKLEQIYTKDDKNVIIETYIGWEIKDPIQFLKRASGNYRSVQENLEALVRTYTNSTIASYDFGSLISNVPQDVKIDKIEREILQLINQGEKIDDSGTLNMEGVEKSLGILVKIFGISKIELPESTTKEVFDRMKEERNRLVQDYKSQGEGEAQKIRAEADAIKEEKIIKAEAKAKEIRGKGDAKAAKYYAVFAKNQELAIWLRKLNSLQKLLSQNKKITLLLDTKTSPFDLLAKENVDKMSEKPKVVKVVKEEVEVIKEVVKQTDKKKETDSADKTKKDVIKKDSLNNTKQINKNNKIEQTKKTPVQKQVKTDKVESHLKETKGKEQGKEDKVIPQKQAKINKGENNKQNNVKPEERGKTQSKTQNKQSDATKKEIKTKEDQPEPIRK